MFNIHKLHSSSAHITPFTQILQTYSEIVIQNQTVFITKDKFSEEEVYIRTNGKTKVNYLHECADLNFFEKRFYEEQKNIFEKKGNKTEKNNKQNFVDRVIHHYLYPGSKIQNKLKSHCAQFLQNSPLAKLGTILLDQRGAHIMNGTKLNETELLLKKERYHCKKTISTKQLANLYQKEVGFSTEVIARYPLDRIIEHKSRKIKVTSQPSKILTFHEPYHVTINEGIFKGEEVKLTTDITIDDNVTLNSYANAPEGYKHFFVHNTGEICYASSNRFSDIGLTTDISAPLTDKTAYQVARVLEEGINNLKYGYNPSCLFAKNISELGDQIE